MSYASPDSTSTKGGAAMSHKDNAAIAIMIKQEQRIGELEAALSELAKWARDIAGDCDDPAKSEQEDEMMERIDKILEQPR